MQRATADTAFWSFYFGLAAVASGVALWLALALRRRLLWGICLFSLNYPLVAALHGFPEWFFGHAALPFQDFMISSLSLFSYATALWLHSEIFDLKKNMPRLHQLLIAAVVLNLVLQVSIPLGFYGFAMQIEGVVFIIITPVLLFTSWWLWRKKAIGPYHPAAGSAAAVLCRRRGAGAVVDPWDYPVPYGDLFPLAVRADRPHHYGADHCHPAGAC
ncbi:histidine kinase [Klebsiella pneumoniae]|uniref:Histidine kinase n=1 Tax=Klebsiella pneumoniae TaxID=573 RepID=A0A377WKY5_KLEPN|nr:histidine kinase [Klebsiella pneumoniae]